MKPINNWRDGWKMFSVQALAVLAALPLVWSQLPPDVQAMLPDEWRPFVLTIIALGGLAGRFVDQEKRE
jgi:hypothetical protein